MCVPSASTPKAEVSNEDDKVDVLELRAPMCFPKYTKATFSMLKWVVFPVC